MYYIRMSNKKLNKSEFEALSKFRYQLRRFLRFSENVTHQHGVTPLQYQLMLQIHGYPGRSWATVAELAERLQASTMASSRWCPDVRPPAGYDAQQAATTSDVSRFTSRRVGERVCSTWRACTGRN